MNLSKAHWIDPLGRTYINEDYDDRIPPRYERVYANHGLVIATLLSDTSWGETNQDLKSAIIANLDLLRTDLTDDEALEIAQHREAAIKSGWIRVRPLGAIGIDGSLVVLFSGAPSKLQRTLLEEAANSQGCVLQERNVQSTAHLSDSPLQPNKSAWLMPDGTLVDIHSEGMDQEKTTYSHGDYVRKWLAFRLDQFYPDKAEIDLATKIRKRSLDLIRAQEIDTEPELSNEEGANFFDDDERKAALHDQCYNQAAEEHGWIRIAPLTKGRERGISAQMLIPPTDAAQQVLSQLEDLHGFQVRIFSEGTPTNTS